MINEFISLLFPPTCPACKNPIESSTGKICLECQLKLPKSNLVPGTENRIEKIFWGRTNVKYGSSYLQFRKGGLAQNILHNIKYKGGEELAEEMGRYMARDIQFPIKFDHVIPVPLHPKKLRRRGFNQSEAIAKGFSEVLSISCSPEILKRSSDTKTQTKKSRFERWKNVESEFTMEEPKNYTSSNFLLVDDVITTGATLEACAQALIQCRHATVSVVTLAHA